MIIYCLRDFLVHLLWAQVFTVGILVLLFPSYSFGAILADAINTIHYYDTHACYVGTLHTGCMYAFNLIITLKKVIIGTSLQLAIDLSSCTLELVTRYLLHVN